MRKFEKIEKHFPDYTPVGPRFSNLVLKALVVLLKEPVPKDHRLFILATSSDRAFLREFGLLNAFGGFKTIISIRKNRIFFSKNCTNLGTEIKKK